MQRTNFQATFTESQRPMNNAVVAVALTVMALMMLSTLIILENPMLEYLLTAMILLMAGAFLLTWQAMRFCIRADAAGIRLHTGWWFRKPLSVPWREIAKLQFAPVVYDGDLSGLDERLRDQSIFYLYRGKTLVIMERKQQQPIVFSICNKKGFESAVQRFFMGGSYRAPE